MAQKDLKPVRSKEEAKERGRNGGIASGKARRKKRAMKSAAKLLLDMPISQSNIAESLKAMGFEEDDLTNQMAMVVSMWKEAMSGNVRAAEFIRDTAGQNADKNRDIRIREKEHSLHQEEFEYKREKEAGVTMEMEDMDAIEDEIYGQAEQEKSGQENTEVRSEEEEDDTI